MLLLLRADIRSDIRSGDVRSLAAIGFNVETVTYKNIKVGERRGRGAG